MTQPPHAPDPLSPAPRAAFLGHAERIHEVFGREGLDRAAELTDLRPGIIDADRWPDAADARWIFSTWGMPTLTAGQLDQLPHLEAVFYAAGSVRYFAPPMLERGITIVSARAANAVPVAEFALAQIILASKNYFANIRATPHHWIAGHPSRASLPVGQGVWDTPVALLGFGTIARLLAQHLRRFSFQILVVDPLVDPAILQAHHAESVSLEEAFARAEVVSNHLPDLPSTRGLITGQHFRALPPNATFINTGRGAQIVEPDLIDALRQRPDLTALLDVTHPEPPAADSPLRSLPNCHLSSHIAGSKGREVRRMAHLVLDDAQALREGRAPQHTVTTEMLEHIA